MYTLGQEDWRFLIVQYVSGIFFNTNDENLNYDKYVNSCLIDRHESAPANLVSVVLINAKIDTDQDFGQPKDPETMLTIDVVI